MWTLPIFDCPVHGLWSVIDHRMSFKLHLLKNCIKQLETNFTPLSEVVTDAYELFSVTL